MLQLFLFFVGIYEKKFEFDHFLEKKERNKDMGASWSKRRREGM